MSHRMLQVNENLQRELSPLLSEVIDWAGGLVTVTQVMVSPDLRKATVWVSALNVPNPQQCIDLLNERSSEFYEPLSERLRMKYVPRLTFELDDKVEEFNRVDSLFEQISGEDEDEA